MDVFVDGELESLLGMFNFDQCSSSKEERPRDEMLGLASLYNDHLHHHQNNLPPSDHHALLNHDMFPFSAMMGGNLTTMLDSWDQNQLQETAPLKRKQLNVDNLHNSNSNCDVTRQVSARSIMYYNIYFYSLLQRIKLNTTSLMQI